MSDVTPAQGDDGETAVHAFPARVSARAAAPELLELIKTTHALDPAIFEGRPPFLWQARISTDETDSYFTRMHASSLKNYAADAAAGVPFQNSHNRNELPMGRSISGAYTNRHGEHPARVESDFYTLPGLRMGAVETDQLIDGMRSGISRDVSIGFYDASYRCSICGGDMADFAGCSHFPGMTYTPKAGGEPVQAFAWVEGARLSEVSAVYKGSNPSAAVTKAYRAVADGLVRADQIRLLEDRYRIRLPSPARRFAVPAIPREEEPVTDPQPVILTADPAVPLTEIRALLDRCGAPAEADHTWLETEVRRLRPLAKDGETYRADLVAAALTEGVRAHGKDFDADTYRGILASLPLDGVKRMRDDWAAVASQVLVGGRQTTDTHEPPKTAPWRAGADALYRA